MKAYGLPLNMVIRLPDDRIGTICWNHLDGSGGVWGEHTFAMPDTGFGDELPAPEFLLREKDVESHLQGGSHRDDLECVGEDFDVVFDPRKVTK